MKNPIPSPIKYSIKNIHIYFKKIGVLHTLQKIKQDASWYLEQGYISRTKSKTIRQRVERLCTELRPHINTLVDGFGIPEHFLNAPIVKN